MEPPTTRNEPYRDPDLTRVRELEEKYFPGPPMVESGNDPFVQSSYVYGLNKSNYDNFLSRKDIALVMFYDPKDLTSHWYRHRFIQAARIAERMNSAFVAVDCSKETALCAKEGIPHTPAFKLVSQGIVLKTVIDVVNFDRLAMIDYVEYAPVYATPKRHKSQCDW